MKANLSPAQIEARAKYDASLNVFRAASRAFTAVSMAYRSREIGDDEYIAGRKAFKDAEAVADAAESDFKDAMKNNQPESTPFIISWGNGQALKVWRPCKPEFGGWFSKIYFIK
jgi:hypothetical protein